MKRKQNRKLEDMMKRPEMAEPDPYARGSNQNKRHNARVVALGPNTRRQG